MNTQDFPRFSVFPRGFQVGDRAVPDNKPCMTVTLREVYDYILHDAGARLATQTLRERHLQPRNASRFKLLNFETATFSCTCTYRKEGYITSVNNLLVLDFDHVGGSRALTMLRSSLLHDDCFDTQMLFVSPSGDGLKWVIEVDDWCGMSRPDFFQSLSNYIASAHHHRPDPSGKDVTRLCFLPHDPNCFINPRYTQKP